jgi:Fe2+ or Zn2+ uptake regulation protein
MVVRSSSTTQSQTPAQLRRDLHATVADKLDAAEQRYTSRRRALVDLLADAGRPVSIADIARLGPNLPRSSAYRNLVDLEAAGVVRRVAANDEFARYELAEDLTEHHHHLVCLGCGTVEDLSPPASLERSVARAIERLADQDGFTVQSHRLDLLGLCSACS